MTLRLTLLFSVLLSSSLSEAAQSHPTSKRDIIVYQEAQRYGGWPANQGIWAWGDEVVVGFTAGWYKAIPSGHAIDSSKPYEKWQARSLDGGSTWSVEKPPQLANAGVMPKQTKLSQPLDFTAPAFALMFQTYNYNTGPSWFHVSTDRGRTWSAAFEFAVEGIEKIATRTNYLVLGPRDCLMFGSAAKANGKEGRVFCARTIDGGLRWKFVSKIGGEPGGYATGLQAAKRKKRWRRKQTRLTRQHPSGANTDPYLKTGILGSANRANSPLVRGYRNFLSRRFSGCGHF